MERMAWSDERLDNGFVELRREMESMRADLGGRIEAVRTDMTAQLEGMRRDLSAAQRQFVQISWVMLGVVIAQVLAFLLTH
jgi:hypothetical protein